ncbi:hypothetical protein V7S43_003809 [Phytophthora oleae]|uniref:BZIP domain-containing protein n=1 Tax=Phytophthora oleae TaxID=2107226 RepID=A0ABD3FW57_9STRA
MQQFAELLDEKTVSLDEILAFVDSSDFDLPMAEPHNPQEDPIGFFNSSMDIEDSPVLSQDHNPDSAKKSKPTVTEQIQIATTPEQDSGTSRKPFQERGRVRDRVIRFRGMVKQLEQQLEDLNSSRFRDVEGERKEQVNCLGGNQNNAVNAGVDDDTDAVTWHEIAMQQFAARQEAEKENLSLRERLEEQLRVAKRLENLIQGHNQVPYDS